MSESQGNKAKLRLFSLMGGKIIFAEKLMGTPTKGALIKALKNAGMVSGYLPDSFPLLSRIDVTQVPVARAFFQDEPPYFDVYFGIDAFAQDILQAILEGKPFNSFEEKFFVKRNATLLSVKEPFVKVLKYPNGRIEKQEKLDFNKLDIFCARNSVVIDDSIVSLIDGSAHQTRDGRVFVYPVLTVKGVGEIHGKVSEEIAVRVAEDIHSHSYLESPSNVFVVGAIHSSYIKAGGNIQALEGIDNTKEVSTSKIIAQGKIIAPFIKKYEVHARDKVLISEGIHHSLVISHDEVWANFIDNSEIRCRKGLVTNNIKGSSRIFLGPSYVKDDEIKWFVSQIEQFEKKMHAKEFVIKEVKDRLEKEKQTLLGYFLRLKEAGKKRIMLDSSIIRLFESLKLTFENYGKAIDDYEKLFESYLANKAYLISCQRSYVQQTPSFIKVLGKIEPGVLIATPGHVVKVSRPLEHVLITVDPITERLRFTNDFSAFKKNEQQYSSKFQLNMAESLQESS